MFLIRRGLATALTNEWVKRCRVPEPMFTGSVTRLMAGALTTEWVRRRGALDPCLRVRCPAVEEVGRVVEGRHHGPWWSRCRSTGAEGIHVSSSPVNEEVSQRCRSTGSEGIHVSPSSVNEEDSPLPWVVGPLISWRGRMWGGQTYEHSQNERNAVCPAREHNVGRDCEWDTVCVLCVCWMMNVIRSLVICGMWALPLFLCDDVTRLS